MMTLAGSAGWKTRKRAELPMGRCGEIEEMVPTVVFIASDEGSYYTGASFNMNGGDVML
jgi:3-oxoacyl-[acyl-carrier protein] reductase